MHFAELFYYSLSFDFTLIINKNLLQTNLFNRSCFYIKINGLRIIVKSRMKGKEKLSNQIYHHTNKINL